METRQTLVVVSVVLLATLAVVVPTVSAAPATSGDDPADQSAISQVGLQSNETATANDSANESAFGNQMTAFMQSSAAQTEDTVEHGMWESAFERANESERARLAHNRTEELNDRLAELRERNQTLYDRYQNGSISREEYLSEASRLSGQIEALEDGVTGTARAAERAGLNVSALDELRTNARNMSGPEVAGVARSLTSGDRGPPEGIPGRGPPGEDGTERRGGGPPEDVPGGQDGDVGNNQTVPPGNGTGGDAENTPRRPDDPGNGDGAGGGQGNGGGDAGPGNGPPGDGDDDDDAPGNGQSGDDAPGNGPPGEGDDDDAPGNSGPGADAPGNDGDGGPGSANGGDSDRGNGSGGNSDGGSSGQGNGGDNPGRGPSSLLTTDILFTR